MIVKSHNHDYFWTENNVIYESYNTIRGLRYRELIQLDFYYPDHDKLSESQVEFLNNILTSKI